MKGFVGIIVLFIVCSLVNAGYKVFNSESLELEEQSNKLVVDRKLRDLGIEFLKENCLNLYRSEYANFIDHSDLYRLNFEYEFNDYLDNISFKEDYYTIYGRYKKAFGGDETERNAKLAMYCSELDVMDSIAYRRTSKVKGDHINLYDENILSLSNHISNLSKIEGIRVNKFEFGDININKYSLILNFSNKNNFVYVDFKSLKKAEEFSSNLSLMYDNYMKNKIYVEVEN